MRYENLIEDCQMQEEEAYLEEEIPWEEEEEEVTDAEMVDGEERGDPEPSGPCVEADTKGPPPVASTEDAVSPEEDAFLMQPASQPEDPAAGSHSPRSKTGTVSGEMAELSLTSPSLGLRKMRLNHESLPLQIEVLNLSPPLPHRGSV